MQTIRIKSVAFLMMITTFHLQSASGEEEGVSTPVQSPIEASNPADAGQEVIVAGPQLADLPDTPAAKPSQSVTVNLINRLVQKGVLTQEEAAEMIEQAKVDAERAKNEAELAAIIPPVPTAEEELSINYIPDFVRNQMRDQIQQELMARAREEQWGDHAEPAWTSKIRPFGDIRVRSENVVFPDGNANAGEFPDFNKINNGDPHDLSIFNPNFAPQINSDRDRQRMRVRARAGAEITLGEGFDAGMRLATGDSNSPVSPNQTLGGSGGNFSKYSVWLDRSFLRYDAGPGNGDEELDFLLGRFDNPFYSSEVQWDGDLGFDGLAMRGKVRIQDNISTFFTAGYFPIYNTDYSFASNQPSKFASNDKWLTGAQLGIDWKIQDDLNVKLAAAYYDFSNIRGQLSSPYIPLSTKDAGDTDASRPGFSQHGNTYIALRNIDNSTLANQNGDLYQYQYFGLASAFRDLSLTGRIDYDHFDPVRISLTGEFIKNLAFDANPVTAIGNRNITSGNYEGGDTAWFMSLIVGRAALEKFGDWQTSLGYRYVESDAVVDGFADSDFGGGGTNVMGYTLGADMALSKDVRCGFRWLSSDEVAGPPLSVDTIQFDINAKF